MGRGPSRSRARVPAGTPCDLPPPVRPASAPITPCVAGFGGREEAERAGAGTSGGRRGSRRAGELRGWGPGGWELWVGAAPRAVRAARPLWSRRRPVVIAQSPGEVDLAVPSGRGAPGLLSASPQGSRPDARSPPAPPQTRPGVHLHLSGLGLAPASFLRVPALWVFGYRGRPWAPRTAPSLGPSLLSTTIPDTPFVPLVVPLSQPHIPSILSWLERRVAGEVPGQGRGRLANSPSLGLTLQSSQRS